MGASVEPKKRVLIVDDEPQIGRIFGLKLKLAGFEAVSTTNGPDALDLVRSQKFDVMLLDVIMPGMSGLDVLQELRTFSQLPVVVFTAKADLFPSARSLGANDALLKPVNPEQLVEKVRALLGGKG